MKRVVCKRTLAFLLCAAFVLALAPAAMASDFYWAPVEGRSVVYHGMDMVKSYETLDIGQKVKVDATQTYSHNGKTFYRVWESGGRVAYMLTGTLPAGIPTNNFIGQAAANTATHLFCTTNTNGGTLTAIPAGSEIKIIYRMGDWYFAQFNTVFYGYARVAHFGELTATLPVAGTTPAAPAASAPTAAQQSGSATGGITTTVKLLNDAVLSKGSVAAGTKLYKTNVMTDANAYAQVQSKGSCNVYYRVDNDFYMIDVNGLYAYVPVQSVVVYDTSKGMTAYAGAVDTILVTNPNAQLAASTAASATRTGTITNCSSWVSMRKSASSSSSRLAKVKKGASVTILGNSGDYIKVQYDGKTGYILGSYIK